MAELNAFSYRSGTSALHGLDVRFKLIFLVLLSLASLKANAPELFVLNLVLLAVLLHAGVTLKSAIKTLRYVFVLLTFVFIARALFTPGWVVIKFKIISITREGIYDGAIVCWRLLIVIIIG